LYPKENRITVQIAEGPVELHYDKLVYALGSMTDTRSVPGVAEHAYTLEAGAELIAAIPAIAGRRGRLIVVGGGLTGIESVFEFAELYPALQITWITGSALDSDLSAAGAAHLRKLADGRITLLEGKRVKEVKVGSVIL